MGPFKAGDRVNVLYCDELQMPCTVTGPDEWCPTIDKKDGTHIYLYNITGKHIKRGNLTTVRVSSGQLSLYQDSQVD